MTVYPSGDAFRLRFGGSFNRTYGSGSITSRAYSDEFPVASKVNNRATDLRAGIDGKLLGFNLSFSVGNRRFRDRSSFSTQGDFTYNTGNTSGVIATFDRSYPVNGDTKFALFNIQRTFAKKLDFTGRVIYSETTRNFQFLETITGLQNCTPPTGQTTCARNIVDLDRFTISGESKRPQTRGDFGVTYAVTDNFRISDTFTFDKFNISGGSAYDNALFTRTAAGGPRNPAFTNTLYHRVTGFQRFVNTIEGDYQFSDRFGFNIGYRYTKREIDLEGFNLVNTSAINNASRRCSILTNENPRVYCEEEKNSTNTLIAGFKAKPLKNWVIYADVEHGEADNAFTRLANYNFTNLRLRSRWSYKQFAFNVSAITKDNENPSTSTAPQGNVTGDFIANTKNRLFSIYADWNPMAKLSLSGGYTFQRLTSETDIVINTGTLVRGRSQFYMRDHYAFFDVSAQPFKRVSVFASYRRNEDLGQGDRTAPLPILITSYPFKLSTAETRISMRLARNIEWNVGYQYIEYNERIQPLSVGAPQDYHANLPYTSLKIYFGGNRDR